MKIIDPHIHLWDLSTGLYPQFETPTDSFIGNNKAIARSYLLDEFLDEAGSELKIAGAVHVEAFPTDPVAETKMIQAVNTTSPVPLAVVGAASLQDPALPMLLDRHCEVQEFRGVRQVVNLHADPFYTYVNTDFMADPAWRDGFAMLAGRDLSFDLQLYPHQIGLACEVLEHSAETRVAVNHAAMWMDRTPEGWRSWRDGLRRLAEWPNVSIKISGLGMFDHKWTTESIRPLIYEVLEAFGTKRSMFASNFPVDKLFSSYRTIWAAFQTCTDSLSGSEQQDLCFETARRFYRLDGD